jgi:hypothetical protein
MHRLFRIMASASHITVALSIHIAKSLSIIFQFFFHFSFGILLSLFLSFSLSLFLSFSLSLFLFFSFSLFLSFSLRQRLSRVVSKVHISISCFLWDFSLFRFLFLFLLFFSLFLGSFSHSLSHFSLGFYFAAHDPLAHSKTFEFSGTKSENTYFSVSAYPPSAGVPLSHFRSAFPVVVSIFGIFSIDIFNMIMILH